MSFTTAQPPLLSVDGATVKYGSSRVALDDVSIQVPAGRTTAVLGGNGAGKTTLMRTLSGTLYRHGGRLVSGNLRLGERSLVDLPAPARVGLGMVQAPEGRRIFGRLTVEENLRLGAINRENGDAVTELSRVFDLFPVLAKRRRQPGALLSGGEQQMLAIGRALMADPTVLLLDEPMLGLAPKIIEQLAYLLIDLRNNGLTLLLVEQNAAVALEVADHAFVLSTGQVALQGTAADLKSDDRVQRLYIGGAVEDARTPAQVPHG